MGALALFCSIDSLLVEKLALLLNLHCKGFHFAECWGKVVGLVWFFEPKDSKPDAYH